MGVKRQWKVMKLRQLPMDESVRGQLIKDIISHKHPSTQLYAWDVHHEGVHLVAKQAFFNRQEAVRNWYVTNKLWEQESPPSGIVVYAWKTDVDNIIKHAKDASVREIQLPRKREMDVAILPSSVQEDIQRTLQNQS
jgi:hypothetical protein